MALQESSTSSADLAEVAQRYAVRTTPFLDQLMDGRSDDDPVVRQFRPSAAELVDSPDDLLDPIGDEVKSPLPGIVHRYADRVLLKPIHVCAAYCRFCFRREQVGPGSEMLTDDDMDRALNYIRTTPEVWEVVLSGGDPLLLSPRRLRHIVETLAAIPHVQVLRIHSRLPIHDPDRINSALIDALRPPQTDDPTRSLAVWIALHINHADELVPPVTAAIGRLRSAGFPLVSQTVLLKGVNNDAGTLCTLFRALVVQGVKPYYLHHPDPAPGTSHFRLSIDEGRAIVQQIHAMLSGLARPTYILDRPNGRGKVPIPPFPDTAIAPDLGK